MKRILLIFVLLYSVQFAFAQFTGSGTYSDPYTGGTLSSDLTWNPGTDTVYVNGDLTIGTSGHLTIDPGVFIKFLSSGCDILINGTGRLSANGSVDDSITFTADFDKDKVHGESGERWGHISFESSTGSSSIEYCIIEYGYKSGSGLEGYGGGIHINSNTVTVENCTIKNNYALWGGGIFVNKSVYPSISKCYFYNNQSAHAGGGIYFWNGASSTVTNCIFEINKSLELTYVNYTGGGLGTGSSCIIKIVNCTFVNNTSSLTQGQSLTLDRSASSKVINSIFWGSSDKQIYCYSTSSASSVINCAYRGITYTNGSPVNPVILNSNNDAPDGPNFTDPGSSDWSIKFVSICRDVGVNSYIGVSIPSTDYNGDPTIYTKDIGTYEVQYSRWTGASGSSWTNSGNWEDGVTPSTGTVDIIIPSGITNYPVETGTVTMGTGNYLILNPKAQATFGILENNSTGTLWLKSDSYIINDSIASLKVDTYTPSGGTTKIELYLQGNSSMWHYISPPIASLAATTFSSASAAVAEYREDLIEDDMNNGWVTSTGYHYDVTLGTPAWVNEGWTWDNLLAGKAYNYYSATSKKFTINGTISTDDVLVDLVYNSGSFTPDYPNAQGYNLIGNPFTCSIDWDLVVEDAANTSVWDDAEATIYFRKSGFTYYYNYGVGETVPDDYNPDGNLIPPMQGFFVKTNADVQLTIPADAKTHSSSKRYKGIRSVPKIRLQFGNTESIDQTLIWFSEKGTLSFDNLLDSRKLFMDEGKPYVYTTLGGIKYAINGINFPENSISIPLVVNANNDGSYIIKATQITDLDNYTIYLRDEMLDNTVNLSQVSSYFFNTTAGLSADRFIIIITNISTAIPENTISNKPFNIYSSSEQINIQTLSDDWSGKQGEVKIIDLTGKTVSLQRNIEFSKDEIRQVSASGTSGIYFVEIRSEQKRFVGKVVIK